MEPNKYIRIMLLVLILVSAAVVLNSCQVTKLTPEQIEKRERIYDIIIPPWTYIRV